MAVNREKITVVIACVVSSEGKILLQKRNDLEFPDAHEKWDFPGGGVDDGESKENALKRECVEEIGCRVVIKRILPKHQVRSWTSRYGKSVVVDVYCYECHLAEGCSPQPSDNEVSEIGWFLKNEIKNLDTLPGITDFLEQL